MKQLSQLIREIIPVILGILIALIINNWNEERKDEKYLNQIFSSLNEELIESRADIIEAIPKQQILLDSLQRYLYDETVTLSDIIEKARGIHGPVIKNYSWKAISSLRIELVEYEKLSALIELDESKESLELKFEKVLDFILNNLKETSPDKKEIFMIMISEIMSTEKYLQLEIEELIEK